MDTNDTVNNILVLLNINSISNINLIYNDPILLECVYKNPKLLELLITQYKHFIYIFEIEISNLRQKLNGSTLNPDAREYIPQNTENLFYLPSNLLDLSEI
jgi:hypothetical protein